ncbi:MAG TPA: FHA domain-containing protein [Candidatus Margulisiibacteriota bacterium]|nr:FHA domain-containing protein [Candidatus Margulisiibacteriota bacterium]
MASDTTKKKAGDKTVVDDAGPPTLQPRRSDKAPETDDTGAAGDQKRVVADKSAGRSAEDVVVPPTLQRPGARTHSDRPPASVDAGTVVNLGLAPAAPKIETAPPPTGAQPAGPGTASVDKGGVADGTVYGSAAVPPQQLSRGTQQESQAPIDFTETVIEKAVVVGIQFNQVEPKAHAATHFLDQSTYLLGRSRECDLRLYSGTASRQHATIEHRGDGWYLVPLEDKQVIADGKAVRGEIRLGHGMRLRLGGDEFEVVDPTAPVSSAGPSARNGRGAVLNHILSPLGLSLAVLLAAAAFGVWWVLLR